MPLCLCYYTFVHMKKTKGASSVKNQLHYFGKLLSCQFGDFFPGLAPSVLLSSLWLFPLLGQLQKGCYTFTGVRRSHFVGVVLFGLVVSGSKGLTTKYGFTSLSVIFFGLSRHYALKTVVMLIQSGYIEEKERRGKSIYYGFTGLGEKKWTRVKDLFEMRLSERAAVLRHMEEIGKPVRFTR